MINTPDTTEGASANFVSDDDVIAADSAKVIALEKPTDGERDQWCESPGFKAWS